MTVVAVVEAVALVVITALLLRHQAEQAAAWTLERRELLTRIQRPEIIPTLEREQFVVPDEVPDEFDLVGTIAEPKAE